MQVFVLISLLFASFVLYSEAQTKPENALTMSQVTNGQTEVMTVGGGCFWCVEAVFQRVEGVLKVESGYAGGTVPNPTYQQVCTGTTGHAEVVQVTFDPKKISYKELLEIFFRTHDPTTPNRQGNDVGPQYRSIILYHSEAQRQIAEEVIRETNAAKIWRDPIVTEVVPFTVFYKAEAYHQNYYNQNRLRNPYCIFVIDPKVEKLRKEYKAKLKKEYAKD
ncbi:MAG: peptide-methionine (S)-S-oxide reductase MsrA [Chloroherpetonaceae bacterium]|nr:peptide-methionine (S)-S-oxide reductase MsrA [Chloroherpetonaceae bacterium]MCS7211047.1 peptide-methionine (S)-S-oxide reductase MsrA [Chloroherpetonaceae bacterium]MDW8467367.1 peptide-methionine (S)-S-oxide reductase MsrA [Chloroherpetonaceae bacterium]